MKDYLITRISLLGSGTACIVKGSYCNCHYCKCEKGSVSCSGYGHGSGKGYGKFFLLLFFIYKILFCSEERSLGHLELL